MKRLSYDEIMNLKDADFAEAWNTGQIQISSLELLGVREYETDEDGNYIENKKEI